MIVIAIAAMISIKADEWENPAYDLLRANGFSVTRLKAEHPEPLYVRSLISVCDQTQKEERLVIRVHELRVGTMEEHWNTFLTGFADQTNMQRSTPSGFPLGQKLYFWVGHAGSSHTDSMCADVYVKMHTRRGATRNEKGVSVFKSGWGAEEAEMFESVARWLMADYAAQTMTTRGVEIAGSTLPGLRTRSGDELVNLARWAETRSLQYRLNEDTGMAAVGSGSSQIIVPLASPKIKVGSNMRNLSSIVAVKDGVPYVDAAVLASLQGL